MSPSEKLAADAKSTTSSAINGQLATPVLSPISEQASPTCSSQALPDSNHEHAKPEPPRERRRSSESRALKLSPSGLHALTASPDSLPLRPLDDLPVLQEADDNEEWHEAPTPESLTSRASGSLSNAPFTMSLPSVAATPGNHAARPENARSLSTPIAQPRKGSTSKQSKSKPHLPPLKIEDRGRQNSLKPSPASHTHEPSPMPAMLPIPPLSLPTYLHLELSSDRPSALYIRPSEASEFPYESAKVKYQRLKNFFQLPPQLEHVLVFGALACLDAWLYTFTILPLRFFKAIVILAQCVCRSAVDEIQNLASFIYSGLGRVWQRQRRASVIPPSSEPSDRRPSADESDQARRVAADATGATTTARTNGHAVPPSPARRPRRPGFRHRRIQSSPSALLPDHKADLLQGLLIICSCIALMWFDASRMYHSIRGQAAIKLYVIYNVLEVFDRLCSALGQDVLECLFSKENLERNDDGRSKVLRPLWMFALALAYTVAHSTILFYQVVTLHVAVNSYSNALLTLLMSNQFVEIKGAVFKKFEKENLFQMTCADAVERFQLWLMLSIIALRNIVEVGGLSISISSAFSSVSPTDGPGTNNTGIPLVSGFVIPKAFTLLPKWTGELFGPFLIVLGSEAVVDWCKHAYITKFNNVKPNIYGRFLDVLAKDYYSHAFAGQKLTKRLGLPVIPLSCLFIRACMQTYHMFIATHMPLPIPSAATSISLDNQTDSSSPATTAALQHIDQVFRRALGRSSFGAGTHTGPAFWWSLDDFIAFATMVTVFLAVYLVLLALKLLLGMALLMYARGRYTGMKEREKQSVDTQGSKRVGGWGTVEVGDDKRRWIYDDDPDGLHVLQEKERKARERAEKGEMKLDGVERYTMAAKRIW